MARLAIGTVQLDPRARVLRPSALHPRRADPRHAPRLAPQSDGLAQRDARGGPRLATRGSSGFARFPLQHSGDRPLGPYSRFRMHPGVSGVAERTPARDEQRACRGAVGSRLLRWHSDSAAKLTTRASSRLEGAVQAGHGRSGRRTSCGIRALVLARFTGFGVNAQVTHSPAPRAPFMCASSSAGSGPAARRLVRLLQDATPPRFRAQPDRPTHLHQRTLSR
jgi:hypothetical protein